MKRWVIVAVIALLTMACSQVRDRSGLALDFYPVTTSLTLDVASSKAAQAQVDTFIEQHKVMLLTSQIELLSTTAAQTRLARYARKRLLVLGVQETNIHLSVDNDRNVFALRVTEYQVKAGKCHYVNYNSLSTMTDDHGCSIESNRWLSMTNPERSAGLRHMEK